MSRHAFRICLLPALVSAAVCVILLGAVWQGISRGDDVGGFSLDEGPGVATERIDEELVARVRVLLSVEDERPSLTELQEFGVHLRPALVHLLRVDRDVFIRSRAAWVLGHVGGPQALDPLLRALADPDESVRGTAVYALGELGLAAAAGPVRGLSESDSSSYVRERAREALSKLQTTPKGRGARQGPRLAGLLCDRGVV